MAAEQIVSSATSAVTGELARILFSGLVGRLDNRQAAAAAADKKLRRLELLLIKVHSAVEASEKHPIENAWLVKWRDKFKEAAAEGDDVLASFRQPAMDSAQAAGDAGQQQQEEHSSSAASTATTTGGACASSSARNDPSGMAYGICGAAMSLSPSNEDMKRLNSAVEKLEELSPEIGDFIKLLKVEILALESKSTEKTERTTATKRKKSRRHSSPPRKRSMRDERHGVEHVQHGVGRDSSFPSMVLNTSRETRAMMNQTATEDEEEQNTLSDRLEKAYAAICRNVELADGRDLRGHEWLAHWASILREAKGQGRAVLGAISARRGGGAGAACEDVVECDDGDREESELGRFVCGMESLAGEVDYFAGLACLCPSY
ncbi:unnamed protein product [Urochloa humidicola]